jgi:hypothetical protein
MDRINHMNQAALLFVVLVSLLVSLWVPFSSFLGYGFNLNFKRLTFIPLKCGLVPLSSRMHG